MAGAATTALATMDSWPPPTLPLLLLGAEVVASIDIFFIVLLLPVVVVLVVDDCDELLLFSCGSLTSPIILLSISLLRLLVFLFDADEFRWSAVGGDPETSMSYFVLYLTIYFAAIEDHPCPLLIMGYQTPQQGRAEMPLDRFCCLMMMMMMVSLS